MEKKTKKENKFKQLLSEVIFVFSSKSDLNMYKFHCSAQYYY